MMGFYKFFMQSSLRSVLMIDRVDMVGLTSLQPGMNANQA